MSEALSFYRGWSKDHHCWAYGSLVHQTDYYGLPVDRYFIVPGGSTDENDIDYPIEVFPDSVSAFTGGHDRDGRMIFDDDILRVGDVMERVFFDRRRLLWSAFIYGETTKGEEFYEPSNWHSNAKVAGNFYENAEMLMGVV